MRCPATGGFWIAAGWRAVLGHGNGNVTDVGVFAGLADAVATSSHSLVQAELKRWDASCRAERRPDAGIAKAKIGSITRDSRATHTPIHTDRLAAHPAVHTRDGTVVVYYSLTVLRLYRYGLQ